MDIKIFVDNILLFWLKKGMNKESLGVVNFLDREKLRITALPQYSVNHV